MQSSLSRISSNNDKDINMRTMANAVRALSMDAVEKANSGHPGLPMGMADVATVLFTKFLRFDPRNPRWPDRDRFIHSAGHGSMLLYSLAYLTGYEDMTIEEIKNFRQLHSRTPGHPEVDPDCGVEITTGPLGQGISSAPGFALAERIMNARFGDNLVNHYTYVLASDGDLQEGISHEACSLAGHLKLARLIVLYDDNGISIDGPTNLSFTEDVSKRFEAYGWDVQSIDGHDFDQIEQAISNAQNTSTPSLICCKTRIGFGAPCKEGTEGAHGSPLGEEEIKGTRKNLDWPWPPFEVPEEILQAWREAGSRSQGEYDSWKIRADKAGHEFHRAVSGDFSALIEPVIEELKQDFAGERPSMATRKTSGKCLEKLVPAMRELTGGSADLTGSVNTFVKNTRAISADDFTGRYIHYGVREHGMAAIMNGMALHGGIVPYSGTFLQFSDYCRPSIRLAALMKQRVIHVMTHDSIGLGEDGPTHQPVEHLAALRAIPNVKVFRPCDGVETAECWQLAINSIKGPGILSLTRQNLPTYRDADKENKCAYGAYVLSPAPEDTAPEITIFASGSEVEIAINTKDILEKDNLSVQVVSVPCLDLFMEQDVNYQRKITGESRIKVAIEAAVRQPWDYLIGPEGLFIGMSTFGESAPYKKLYEHFGISADIAAGKIREKL
jgi:transketolase